LWYSSPVGITEEEEKNKDNKSLLSFFPFLWWSVGRKIIDHLKQHVTQTPPLLSLELVVFDYIARDDIKWQSELQMRSNAALLIVTRNIVSSIENRKQVTDWFSSLVEALC